MNRVSVGSSNLKAVGYDPRSQILEIAFHNGGVYEYYGVPVQVHESLMNAGSLGRFLHHNIKGVYSYSKVR